MVRKIMAFSNQGIVNSSQHILSHQKVGTMKPLGMNNELCALPSQKEALEATTSSLQALLKNSQRFQFYNRTCFWKTSILKYLVEENLEARVDLVKVPSGTQEKACLVIWFQQTPEVPCELDGLTEKMRAHKDMRLCVVNELTELCNICV